MTEKVSIIVPVYNVEQYLDRCIDTLINQTYPNMEIILVNDGSTDLSGDICHKWETNTHVEVVDQINRGVSAARNTGLEYATGSLIMFIDADDWLEHNMVEAMVSRIDAKDFCYCAYRINTNSSERILRNAVPDGEYEVAEIYAKLFFGTGNKKGTDMATALWRGLFRKNIIDRFHIRFDTYIRFAEDWLFYAEYFSHIASMIVINEPLYHYYQRSNSLTHTFIPTTELGIAKSAYILKRFGEIALSTQIDKEVYAPFLLKRSIGLVLNVSKNQWNHRNCSTVNQKIAMIRLSMNESNIRNIQKSLDNSNISAYTKFWVVIISNEIIWPISLYGIIYNIMRSFQKCFEKLIS